MGKTPHAQPQKPAETESPKVGKLRSPNFPVIDLEKATEKAKTLHESYRVMPVSTATAATKLGYKPESSVAGQVLAAMRAFGLIVAEGSGSNRKVRVSDDGSKIVLNHPSRQALLQAAATAPKVHREMWDKFYAGKAAPDPDDLIKHYLQWDRPEGKFNPESLSPLLNQFKRTIAFARLDSSATIPTSASHETDNESEDDAETENDQQNDSRAKSREKQGLKVPQGSQQDVFSLPEGQAILQWPAEMTADGFQDLEDWLKLALRKIKRSIRDDKPDDSASE